MCHSAKRALVSPAFPHAIIIATGHKSSQIHSNRSANKIVPPLWATVYMGYNNNPSDKVWWVSMFVGHFIKASVYPQRGQASELHYVERGATGVLRRVWNSSWEILAHVRFEAHVCIRSVANVALLSV